MKVMEKAGFAQKVGQENFCENIDRAIKRAEDTLSVQSRRGRNKVQ